MTAARYVKGPSGFVNLSGGSGFVLPELVEFAGSATATAGGTAHTVGAWQQLIASTDADADLLYLTLVATNSNTNDTTTLIDVATGAGGSETAIVTSIPAGFSGATFGLRYYLPVSIAAGTRVAFRARSVQTSKSVTAAGAVYSCGNTVGATLDTIGATTASSRGTNLPTRNTWVQLTASTSQAYKAVVVAPCAAGSNALSNETVKFTLGMGAGGSEVELTTAHMEGNTAEQFGLDDGALPSIYVGNIPAGSRLAVKTDAGTDRNYHDVILFGVPA